MERIHYHVMKKSVRDNFYEARSWGLSNSEAAGMTMVDFEMIAARSKLEHLFVYLALGMILHEESFSSSIVQKEVLHHVGNKTIVGYKAHLDTSEYDCLLLDLDTLTNKWQ